MIGEKGIGDWQELEYDEALDKWAKWQKKSPDFALIVVLLEGQIAPGLQFLRRMHWIITRDPTSEMDLARIFDAAAGRNCNPSELWRHTSPIAVSKRWRRRTAIISSGEGGNGRGA